MRTTTQAFEMIKIVKLYSWEDYFLNKIRKEREEELIYFRKTQIVSLFIESITWSIGPILSFVSVFTYNLFNEPMRLSKLLTSLYIFHNLADPLFLIPEYINGLMDSLLSLKRLEAFLFSKEYVPSQMINMNKTYKKNNNLNIENNEEKEKEKEKEIMIDIDDIEFGIIKREEEFRVIEDSEKAENENNEGEISKLKKPKQQDIELEVMDEEKANSKDKKEKLLKEDKDEEASHLMEVKNQTEKIEGTVIVPLLKNINLKIRKGELIGIIGEFGSGKTCLFNAILNNLDILNGTNKKIILNGSVAYVPQKAWILNDTVRNNIIFNKPFNNEKYKTVVKICQLEPDFELLKQGDLTIISDKGDNLSGGQKN